MSGRIFKKHRAHKMIRSTFSKLFKPPTPTPSAGPPARAAMRNESAVTGAERDALQ